MVENFKPGTLEKWGLGWEDLSKLNPRLVMVRISGFGQDGPYSQRPGYGVVCEAVSGLRHLTGDPDRAPARVGVSMTDYIAGLHGAYGAVMALMAREKTGRGQCIDAALYEMRFNFMEAVDPAPTRSPASCRTAPARACRQHAQQSLSDRRRRPTSTSRRWPTACFAACAARWASPSWPTTRASRSSAARNREPRGARRHHRGVDEPAYARRSRGEAAGGVGSGHAHLHRRGHLQRPALSRARLDRRGARPASRLGRHGRRRAAAVRHAGRRAPCRPRHRPGYARRAARVLGDANRRAHRCARAGKASESRPGRHERRHVCGRRAQGQGARAMGGPEKLARRKAAGVLNARERIEYLLDAGTFIESGLFGASTRPAIATSRRPTARSRASARSTAASARVVANDFTVMGASSSATNGRKIGHMKRVATSRGLPMVFLGESLGRAHARPHGRARHGHPARQRSARNTCACARRRGPRRRSACATARRPGTRCCRTSTSMRKGAVLAVSSAQLASLAIKEKVDPEEMGGWQAPCRGDRLRRRRRRHRRGGARRDQHFLSYLPSHHNQAPPEQPVPAGLGRAMARHRHAAAREAHAGLRRAQDRARDRRRRQLLRDQGALRQGADHRPGTARRHDGRHPRQQSAVPGGAIDTDACDKVASFLVLCDSFNIPVVMLVDTPGSRSASRPSASARPARS